MCVKITGCPYWLVQWWQNWFALSCYRTRTVQITWLRQKRLESPGLPCQTVTYGSQVHPEKIGDFLLVEPEGLGLVEDLDPDRPLLGLVQNEFPFVGLLAVGHTGLLYSLEAVGVLGLEASYRIGLPVVNHFEIVRIQARRYESVPIAKVRRG